jgi:hypothetical protein
MVHVGIAEMKKTLRWLATGAALVAATLVGLHAWLIDGLSGLIYVD